MNIPNRKILKPLLIAMAVLAAMYLTIYLVGKHYLTNSAISARLEQELGKKLNRKVAISDQIGFSVTWSLAPLLVLHDVSIANLPNAKQQQMLTVGTIEVEVRLIPLLFDKFHITNLKLVKPSINLETIKDQNNWHFDEEQDDEPSTMQLIVDHIEIENGHAEYILNGELRHTLTIDELTASIGSNFETFKVKIKGLFNKAPLNFSGEFERDDNKTLITIDKFELNKIKLTGNLLVQHDPRVIKGELVASSFSLNDAMGNDDSSNSNGQYSLPTKEFPIANLQNNAIDINIKIKKFELNKLTINDVNFYINSQKNVINAGFKPAINLAGGSVNLDMKYDLNPGLPAFSLNLKSTPMRLEVLLDTLLGKSPLTGSNLTVDADLTANGTNLDALVANSRGKILLNASAGVYLNTGGGNIFSNILTALITFKKSDPNTPFSCAIMNFKVNNGMAVANNGIGLEASSVNVLGNGQVNLRNGIINFSITPQNTSNNPIDLAQFSAAQAITITGTISQPQVALNPIALISSSPAVSGIAATFAGIPVGIATLAKEMVDPATNHHAHPCATALGN